MGYSNGEDHVTMLSDLIYIRSFHIIGVQQKCLPLCHYSRLAGKPQDYK